MPVQINEKAVRLGSWTLTINGQDIGLVKDVEFTIVQQVARIRAHNGELPPRKKITEAKLKFTMFQIDLQKLGQLQFGQYSEQTDSDGNVTQKILTWKDFIQAINSNILEFYTFDENNKKFGVRLPKAYIINEETAFPFWDDYKLEESMTVQIEVAALPDDTGTLFEIIDEQDV